MITGQPLWIQQRKGIAAPHRNAFPNSEDMPIDIGRINTQPQGPGIRYIARRSDGGRRRRRLRPCAALRETFAVTKNESAAEKAKEFCGVLNRHWVQVR